MASGIQKLYTQIPETYELVNHLLTFGLDIFWRKKLIKKVKNNHGLNWLDVCTGTGETAVYLTRISKNGNQVFATDFSFPMVRVAKKKNESNSIKFSISEIKRLPFLKDTFDLITLSFATRNINTNRQELISGLSEINRVLKTGGIFFNLETSQPTNPVVRTLFHWYAKIFIKPIGSGISGSKAAYSYLASSMTKFYNADELKTILYEAGFQSVEYECILFGAAAIHSAIK